jgi:hypothetical protein
MLVLVEDWGAENLCHQDRNGEKVIRREEREHGLPPGREHIASLMTWMPGTPKSTA